MTHDPKDQNSPDYIREGRNRGEWWDHTTNPERYLDLAEAVTERFDYSDRDEMRIADAGSSTGEAIDRFAGILEKEYGLDAYVVGIDVAEFPLRQALENGFIDEGRVGRVQDWQPEPGKYDAVVSKTLLPQIDPGDQSDALERIERAVNPEGFAALQIDPYGKDIFKGYSYVFSGEELSETSEKTEGFRDYPLDGILEDFFAADLIPGDETGPDPVHEFYEGYLGGMRAELDRSEKTGDDLGDDETLES